MAPRSSFEDVADSLHDNSHPVIRDGNQLPRLTYDNPQPRNTIAPPVQHCNGMEFGFIPTQQSGAAIGFADSSLRSPKSQLVSLQGYMQGPAAGVTDKVFNPLAPILKEHGTAGMSYAHGNRGTSNVLTRQGRYTVGDIQNDVSADLRDFNMRRQSEVDKRLPTVLMGHSQGGQHVAHILANPEKYGFAHNQIRGVILMNSMLIPHSQPMVMTPGFVWDIARKSLGDVAWSIVGGKGLLFRGQKAFDAFVGEGDPNGVNERRVTDNTFPDSGLFFTQTLTTGTSPSLKNANLHGLPVSIVISEDDQLMGQELQSKTADYLDSLGANVVVRNVPGKHFSPIVTLTGESQDRTDIIMHENRFAFEYAFRDID